GPVGSGGSISGTARHLRQGSPDLRTIAVDAHGSILFGRPDGHRVLRGLGMSVLPANLDHTLIDEVHWLTESDAFPATRRLHRERALFMGPTSGASHLVGTWWAARNPDALTVLTLPDEGHRYLDTVYHDPWLAGLGLDPSPRPEPRTVHAVA